MLTLGRARSGSRVLIGCGRVPCRVHRVAEWCIEPRDLRGGQPCLFSHQSRNLAEAGPTLWLASPAALCQCQYALGRVARQWRAGALDADSRSAPNPEEPAALRDAMRPLNVMHRRSHLILISLAL